jgi:hypothetical protein
MVLFWGVVKIAVFLAGGGSAMGTWLANYDPYQTLFAIHSPLTHYTGLDSVRISALGPVLAMLGLGVVLNLISIARLRVWNPSRFIYLQAEAKADQTKVRKAAARKVWANPVLWREIRTRGGPLGAALDRRAIPDDPRGCGARRRAWRTLRHEPGLTFDTSPILSIPAPGGQARRRHQTRV